MRTIDEITDELLKIQIELMGHSEITPESSLVAQGEIALAINELEDR